MMIFAGCSGLEGTDVLDKITSIEERLTEVERLLEAEQSGLVISSVEETVEGYLIVFSDGSTITVKHGKDGQDGADGKDGENGKDGADGKDGQDGKDGENGKDGVDGEDGKDGADGKDGQSGDSLIASVEIKGDNVVFTLTDGRVITIPMEQTLSIEFDYSHITQVYPLTEYTIPYTVKSANSDKFMVEAFASNTIFLLVNTIPDENDSSKGVISFVFTGESMIGGYSLNDFAINILKESKITVLATDGHKVIMESLKFENAMLAVADNDEIYLPAEGGQFELKFFSNIDYNVELRGEYYESSTPDWMTLVGTKALQERSVTIDVAPNDTYRTRAARIIISSEWVHEEWEDGLSLYLYLYQNGKTPDTTELSFEIGPEAASYYDPIEYGYEGNLFHPFEVYSKTGDYMNCTMVEGGDWFDYGFYGGDTSSPALDWFRVSENIAPQPRVAVLEVTEELYSHEIDEYVNYVTYRLTITQRGNTPSNNEIWYTSNNGEPIFPYWETDSEGNSIFGANVTSYSYDEYSGKGILYFDDDVTSVGLGAFYQSYNLTSISLPATVTEIGVSAFDSCTQLESINIPDGVTSIGNDAFWNCESLYGEMHIPESVEFIGQEAFGCCPITSFSGKFASEDGKALIMDDTFVCYASSAQGDSYSVPDGITTIYPNAFVLSTLRSIHIPDSVTLIAGHAFQSCFNLTDITLPSGLTTINGGVFRNCISLTGVDIPTGVTSIGVYAFLSCESLESITIPNGVTEIGGYAFAGSGLTSMDLPDNLTSLGNNAYAATKIYDINIPQSITTIPDELFYNCDNLTSVTIPGHITSLGDGIFAACNSLTDFSGNFASTDGLFLVEDGVAKAFAGGYIGDFSIPNDITTIGKLTFAYTGLNYITLSASVTTIQDVAFVGSQLQDISMPNVQTIGYEAFLDCYNLSEIVIPSSTTYIGDYAFAYCENLINVYSLSETPPTVEYGDNWNGFRSANYLSYIYVPDNSVEAYQTTAGWSKYASYIYPMPTNAPEQFAAAAKKNVGVGMVTKQISADDKSVSYHKERDNKSDAKEIRMVNSVLR